MKTNRANNILEYIKKHKEVKPAILAKYLHISRVATHKHLRELLFQGKIEKIGVAPHVVYALAKKLPRKYSPHYLWDYDYSELKKTEQGRIKILERMINYGPAKGEKIPLDQVKKYWNKLELNYLARRLFELLIWGKYQSSPRNKNFSWM